MGLMFLRVLLPAHPVVVYGVNVCESSAASSPSCGIWG